MAKQIRRQIVRITFDRQVKAQDAAGVTITVHGNPVTASLLTPADTVVTTLEYTVPRAIFRHDVTFQYDSATGNITTAAGADVPDIPQAQVSNDLPTYTVWDWDAPSGADSQWDTDQTRFDEAT